MAISEQPLGALVCSKHGAHFRTLSKTLRNDSDRDMGGVGAQIAPDQVVHTAGHHSQHPHKHTRVELPLITQHDVITLPTTHPTT